LQVLAYIGKGYPKAGEPEGQPDQGELGISWGGKVGGGRRGRDMAPATIQLCLAHANQTICIQRRI